ncbi:EAL domain-containing protein [uncultured Cellulomonas sp.]|uniref:EAL domain-containing protein n=1 Tax=uncultured Cellulomonas sp. TaxID=189682 RepID=UPI002601A9E8|nr:EAL domain-containing protein [uncultured Cellulomonas sp.]
MQGLAAVVDRRSHAAARLSPAAAVVVLATMLAIVWAVVSVAGTRTALPHLFYLPIMLSAMMLGARGAVPTAVAAAILCGPLMPIDSATGAAQSVAGWSLRGAMFLCVGLVVSAALASRERRIGQEVTGAMSSVLFPTGSRAAEIALVPLVAGVLERREFHPVFQPIYSFNDGRLVAVEALTRFDTVPRRPPDAWFAAARCAGLRVELEVAAIESALEASGSLEGVPLSVNASPTTLIHPALRDLVQKHTDRPLTIELTEHDAVDDYAALLESIGDLRRLGVLLAVDDAGAGVSSVRHIVQLCPDVIKLDASLAQGVATNRTLMAMGQSILDFARRSGARLVVEGIEEMADLQAWAAMGADAVQGYVVGRPGPLPAAIPHPTLVRLANQRSRAGAPLPTVAMPRPARAHTEATR